MKRRNPFSLLFAAAATLAAACLADPEPPRGGERPPVARGIIPGKGLDVPEPEGPEVAPHLCGSDDGGGHDPDDPDDTDDCHLDELVVCPFEGMIKDGKGGCRCPEWQKLGPDGCEDKGGDSGEQTGEESGEAGETGEGKGEGSSGDDDDDDDDDDGDDDDEERLSVNLDCDAAAVRGRDMKCYAKVSNAEGTITYEWLFEPDSGARGYGPGDRANRWATWRRRRARPTTDGPGRGRPR